VDASAASARDDVDALVALTAALGRLDPVSYWTVPADQQSSGDVVVSGITGVFLVAAYDRRGVLTMSRGTPRVDGQVIPGLRRLRIDAKRLTATLGAEHVFAQAEPVVCLTRATVGVPQTARGVRIAGLDNLTKDLTSRPVTLQHARAQRVVRALGMRIAGDQRRHFVT
jgi:hypothetical protein